MPFKICMHPRQNSTQPKQSKRSLANMACNSQSNCGARNTQWPRITGNQTPDPIDGLCRIVCTLTALVPMRKMWGVASLNRSDVPPCLLPLRTVRREHDVDCCCPRPAQRGTLLPISTQSSEDWNPSQPTRTTTKPSLSTANGGNAFKPTNLLYAALLLHSTTNLRCVAITRKKHPTDRWVTGRDSGMHKPIDSFFPTVISEAAPGS